MELIKKIHTEVDELPGTKYVYGLAGVVMEEIFIPDPDATTLDPETMEDVPLSDEQKRAAHRRIFNIQRDRRFGETEWIKSRAEEVKTLYSEGKISQARADAIKAKYIEYLEYRQALRNMPQAEDFDPRNPNWPTKPE